MKGKVKEKAGQVTNNPDLKAEGKAEHTAGKVEKKVGQIEKVLPRPNHFVVRTRSAVPVKGLNQGYTIATTYQQQKDQ